MTFTAAGSSGASASPFQQTAIIGCQWGRLGHRHSQRDRRLLHCHRVGRRRRAADFDLHNLIPLSFSGLSRPEHHLRHLQRDRQRERWPTARRVPRGETVAVDAQRRPRSRRRSARAVPSPQPSTRPPSPYRARPTRSAIRTPATGPSPPPARPATLTVTKATPTITWSNPADITYGTALSATQLDATASVPGTFTYNPAAGTVLHAGTGQTLSVTFTPTDTADYTTAAATATINVEQGHAHDHLVQPGGHHLRHGAFGHPARCDRLGAGHVHLHPARGHGLDAGTGQTLSVTFTPTDTTDYTTAAATATINVDKATPTITWSNPADITYGTALSATQLDATASVPGTFTYNPPAGTVLNAGHGPDALGHLHADRHDRLHDRLRHGDDQRRQGHAHDHLVQPGGHHLRHGAFGHPARCDRLGARHLHLHPARGHGLNAGTGQTLSVSVSRPPTRPITRPPSATATINVDKARPRSPGPTRRTSPTGPRCRVPSSMPRPTCRGRSRTRRPPALSWMRAAARRCR